MLKERLFQNSVVNGQWIEEFHNKFNLFSNYLEEAKNSILNLTDDWDEEESKSYREETWDRAVDIAKNLVFFLWKETQQLITPPNLLPGPDGSIDIQWKTEKFDLLINVPEDPQELPTFSSDDFTQNSIKGTLDSIKMQPVLFSWLIELL